MTLPDGLRYWFHEARLFSSDEDENTLMFRLILQIQNRVRMKSDGHVVINMLMRRNPTEERLCLSWQKARQHGACWDVFYVLIPFNALNIK